MSNPEFYANGLARTNVVKGAGLVPSIAENGHTVFKVGSVVRLNSGGPLMTVEGHGWKNEGA